MLNDLTHIMLRYDTCASKEPSKYDLKFFKNTYILFRDMMYTNHNFFSFKGCSSGSYGPNCSLTCGQCRQITDCNHVTGHCSDGCVHGYITEYCNTSKIILLVKHHFPLLHMFISKKFLLVD